MDSILLTIKKMLGLVDDYTVFDTDIIIHINSVLSALQQMGIGAVGFSITGDEEQWNDFLADDSLNLSMVKSYVYMRVRLLFDPPSSGTVIEAYNKAISEFEWRAFTAVETPYFGGIAPELK